MPWLTSSTAMHPPPDLREAWKSETYTGGNIIAKQDSIHQQKVHRSLSITANQKDIKCYDDVTVNIETLDGLSVEILEGM